MDDKLRFAPGDTAIRMAGDIPSLGIFFGVGYEVESFNPHAVDGLKLLGISKRLNANNFENLDHKRD